MYIYVHLDTYHYYAIVSLYELHTYHEASTNHLWKKAMEEELHALVSI